MPAVHVLEWMTHRDVCEDPKGRMIQHA